MDTITISDLEVFYHVGVPDAERARAQRLLITVEMQLDFHAATATDDLIHTVDYFAASQRLLRLGEGQHWKLIEKLAADIANIVLTEFKVSRVTVEVKKFIIPQTKYVSVKLTRDSGNTPPSKV